ncbi:exported hypothetical protein [Acidobacteriia bacterium SbA2]|nr:exported hypothetical protein [Acidobacteriia bacterium SbA2]
MSSSRTCKRPSFRTTVFRPGHVLNRTRAALRRPLRHAPVVAADITFATASGAAADRTWRATLAVAAGLARRAALSATAGFRLSTAVVGAAPLGILAAKRPAAAVHDLREFGREAQFKFAAACLRRLAAYPAAWNLVGPTRS